MNDHLRATLESLVQANTDCWSGLETAAKNIKDTDCLILLRQLAEERSAQTYQLQQVLAMDRDFPELKGTLAGSMRQLRIVAQGTLSGQDELSILPEVGKAQERLRQEYEAALPEAENSPVSELITTHLESVTTACQSLAEMSELMKRRAGTQS